MANSDDDEEEFDELFSFGTTATDSMRDANKDEEEDIFGTPAAAPAATSDDDDLFGDPSSNHLGLESQTDEDFHRHDADTRDFLEWLDKDDKPADSAEEPSSHDVDIAKATLENQASSSFDFDAEILGTKNSVNTNKATSEKKQPTSMPSIGNSPSFEVDTVMVKQSQQQKEDDDDDEKSGSKISKSELDESSDSSSGGGSEKQPDERSTFETKTGGSADYIDAPKISSPRNEAMSPHTIDDDDDDDDEPEEIIEEEEELPSFETLGEAIRSPKATKEQVRSLCHEMVVSTEDRPLLWCKLICGKSLDDVSKSSVANSFQDWRTTSTSTTLLHTDQVEAYAKQIISKTDDGDDALQSLSSILLYHYQSSGPTNVIENDDDGESTNQVEWDPLLPPLAAVLLSAGLDTTAANVLLSKIMPTSMALMALSNEERWVAAKALHSKFYLLACYHLPLLVFHLDRCAPGWHWPKLCSNETTEETITNNSVVNATKMGRNLESQGVISMSWFLSQMAGECSEPPLLDPPRLLALWDVLLLTDDNSLKFFLAISVLERHSDTLLMLRSTELAAELTKIMELKPCSGQNESHMVEDDRKWVQQWCQHAKSIADSTPKSVIQTLCESDDEAVMSALMQRQELAEVQLQERLEGEAKAHRKALEADKQKKVEEARAALIRARLIKYYQKHNPEKADTVDNILEVFQGRLDILEAKLKIKYGEGFLPPPAIKLSATTNKLLSSMNTGLVTRKQKISTKKKSSKEKADDKAHDLTQQVVVKLSPTEILPVIFHDKGGSDLKFYLVDSRPDEMARYEGRFPTAVSLSPEALLDPDRIQEQVEMFEALRGAVHICVMGEGFSSFPTLYNHRLTSEEEKLLEEDESRTSNCALFFIKRGFPFVSILDGGFAAAHAWVAREGPSRGLEPSVLLVDYDEDISIFSQLEKAYQEQQELAHASVSVKTSYAIQKLVDTSMASLTRTQQRIDNLATDENRQKMIGSMSKLFSSTKEKAIEKAKAADEMRKSKSDASSSSESVPKIKSSFSRMLQSSASKTDSSATNTTEPKSVPTQETAQKMKSAFGSFLSKSEKKETTDTVTTKEDSKSEVKAQEPKKKSTFSTFLSKMEKKESTEAGVDHKTKSESNTKSAAKPMHFSMFKAGSTAPKKKMDYSPKVVADASENDGAKVLEKFSFSTFKSKVSLPQKEKTDSTSSTTTNSFKSMFPTKSPFDSNKTEKNDTTEEAGKTLRVKFPSLKSSLSSSSSSSSKFSSFRDKVATLSTTKSSNADEENFRADPDFFAEGEISFDHMTEETGSASTIDTASTTEIADVPASTQPNHEAPQVSEP